MNTDKIRKNLHELPRLFEKVDVSEDIYFYVRKRVRIMSIFGEVPVYKINEYYFYT